MNFREEINKFIPSNEQEEKDKKEIIRCIDKYGDIILLRDNNIGHITSSGFIMNKDLTKVLMIHHNLRNLWSWTGGHADGERDLLKVAIKEAMEETGLKNIIPLSKEIASIDVLPVVAHLRRGEYVPDHCHFSVAYIIIASEDEELILNIEETSDVRWFDLCEFNEKNFSNYDLYLYEKLIKKAKFMHNKEKEVVVNYN